MTGPPNMPMKAVALGFVAGCAACALVAVTAAVAVVAGGLYDVTARDPHSAAIDWVVHATMIHAEQRLARGIPAPPRFTAQDVTAGARAYAVECAGCHGAPGVARARWVAGMTPPPPYLVDATRRWTGPQLYSIVGDGVKMTAMPAWRVSRPSRAIWQLVAFLQALPYLSPRDYERITRGRQSPAG